MCNSEYSQSQYTMLLRCANLGDMTEWNYWREQNPSESINLSGAFFIRSNLSGANLKGANLTKANLWGANLNDTDLHYANLEKTYLLFADLDGVRGLDSTDQFTYVKHQAEEIKIYLKHLEDSKEEMSLTEKHCRTIDNAINKIRFEYSRYAPNNDDIKTSKFVA